MRTTGKSDLTNPSMSTELLALKERRIANLSNTNLSNKKKIAVGFCVTFLMTSLIVFFIWQIRIDAEAVKTVPTISTEQPPVVDEIGTPGNRTAVNEAETAVGENDMVSIRFSDLPKGATIRLNQQPVEAPIQTTRSQTPHFLEITRGRERLFSATIVPDRDRLIKVPSPAVSMKTKQESKKKRATQPRPKTPSESGLGDLSSNPFPLKKNPFAPGE